MSDFPTQSGPNVGGTHAKVKASPCPGRKFADESEAEAIENPTQEEKSRSQIKRECRELKDLGIKLTGLTKGQLRRIPLSEEMLAAVLAAKEMRRRALQRQYRFLASLLADENVVAIRAALAGKPLPPGDTVTRRR